MTEDEKNRLIKVELILPEVQKSLNKILENQSVITELKLDAEANKKFRDNFSRDVSELIAQRLNTINFEQALNEQIEKQVMIIFNKPAVRGDLTQKIKEVFFHQFKQIQLSMYWKLTGVAATIATALATFVIKGMLGGS